MGAYDILVKPFVKKVNPEKGSRVALRYFKFSGKIPGMRMFKRLIYFNRPRGAEKEVFGLYFYNPVGLGAGLDTAGDVYNDINNLGFSFMEIGPLDAKGMRHAIENLQDDPQDDILAACIDKDHLTAFSLGYDFCDFFVIDVNAANYEPILDSILDARLTYEDYKPIVAKIPEHIEDSRLAAILDYCMLNNVDGIEARSIEQIRFISGVTKGRYPIIGNCHIMDCKSAEECIEAGASLIEIRSGLVNYGPKLVYKINRHLAALAKKDKY